MYRLGLIVFSAMFLVVSPAAAKDVHQDKWIVSQLSGEARVVHAGLQAASLKLNTTLSPGDVIVTGPSGRAMLSHDNADYIVVAPRSELRLPAESQPSGLTRVIQKVGTMLFRVQHTGVPHFAVDTPMLAAVVKGTTFTIIVDQNRSAVQVTQGLVEVSANDGGMKELVEGGKTVFIENRNPKAILDADTQTQKPSPNATGAVKVSGSRAASLTTIASLMSGLVRPETAPQQVPASASAAVTTTIATGPVPGATGTIADPVSAVTDPANAVIGTVSEPTTDVIGGTTAPVSNTIGTGTAPVTDVIGTVTAPVTDVIGTVTDPATNVIGDAAAPVTDVIGTVTAPVTEVIGSVAPPVTDVVGSVTAPVTEVIGTVTAPVTDTITTVTAPVTDTITTVTQPVTGLLGSSPPPPSPAPAPAPPPPPSLLGVHL